MGNLDDIVLEIKYTKMRNDFYRYLAWRIQTVDLERKINSRNKTFNYPLFTNKSWKDIEKFVKAACQEYITNLILINRPQYSSCIKDT